MRFLPWGFLVVFPAVAAAQPTLPPVGDVQILGGSPLFLTLVVVEFTDVVFAVDSIPAVFAVTRDPFIVLTSNVFALLGMRSLYFLLADANGLFRFLKFGLVLILWFVGAKMLLAGVVKIPISLSLAVVGGILAGSIALSILLRPRISCSPEAKARL